MSSTPDIVDQLRTCGSRGFEGISNKAAAEITRLREQVAALTAERDICSNDPEELCKGLNEALDRAGVNLCEIETYAGAIDSAIATAVRKERERCCKIAESHKEHHSPRHAVFVIDDIIEEINRP
jgi:hypothetical protein